MELKLNFRQCAEIWKEEKWKTVKASSMAAYSLLIEKYLLPNFDFLGSIQEKDIQGFVNYFLKEGLSVKSVKDILSVLRMIMKFWSSKGYDVINTFNVVFPKPDKIKELPVFTINQQKTLLNFLTENISNKNIGIILCLNTGIRIGELCALRWKDIDLVNGILRIEKTIYRIYDFQNKGKKSKIIFSSPKTPCSFRSVPLSSKLVTLLKTHFYNIPQDSFLITGTRNPIEPRSYRNHFKKILKQLNLPDIRFHGLRHSFATRCIESQCDYKTVSVILGHSDITTTLNLYVHPSQDQKKQCIEKMLKYMDDGGGIKC